jgi:hypothetical protein
MADTEAAARRLQDYAEKYIQDIAEDYEFQIKKWNKAVNLVVTAFDAAVEQHKQTLKDAKELETFRAELAILALSLVTAGTMSWMKAVVQYKVGSRLFKRVAFRDVHIVTRAGDGSFGAAVEVVQSATLSSTEYNQVMASTLGAVAEDVGSAITDRVVPDFHAKLRPGASTLSVTEFGGALKNLVIEAAVLVGKQIRNAGVRIRESRSFGQKWLAEAGGSEERAEELIKRQIERVRQQWADKWVYYGRDPSLKSPPALADTLEREIWACWILDQDIREVTSYKLYRGDKVGFPALSDKIPSVVVTRLVELNVIAASAVTDIVRQSVSELRGGAPKPSVSNINGAIDTSDELKRIQKWAKTHRLGMIEAGHPRGIPRKLGRIEEIYKG